MSDTVSAPMTPANGKARLLEAAAAAFASKGYAATSVAAIAREAQLGKSTVFHHFENKEALYLAVIADAVESFGERLNTMLSSRGPTLEVLGNFQREHLLHMRENRQVTQLILRELQAPALAHKRSLVVNLLRRNLERLAGFLERAQQGGEIRADANCRLAAMFLFMANSFFFQHEDDLALQEGLAPHQYSDTLAHNLVQLLYNGLAPEAAHGAQQ